ncbi:alpha/beta hydrolase [Rhodococcus sp. Z13]|uniref:Alpha/beta hydrolase n=1 Tax=Rhodococcus sacchari TaxID=2962047 RepID=A0ACD4DFF3_9NOCA|nr:alpha/beta hydrolase [Rhodococcus sp. Z13]UYP18709.1 alpha/beta hydrolase [Rhodococcus sp. Z13]
MAAPTSRTDRNTISRVTVVADDGVPLAATVTGPPDADMTLVCLHGHCQDSASWSPACDLVTVPGIRVIRYDQRGYGRSGTSDTVSSSVSAMADDLDAVLRTLAPDGPVVLAGYSMGGMVALAYARRHSDAVGTRVVGAGLFATAASGLAEEGIGRCLRHPATTIVHRAVSRAPRMMELSKRAGGRVCTVAARRRPPESWLRLLGSALSHETSIVTWSRLLSDVAVLDESAALAVLSRVPAVVAAGTEDVFVPLSLSEAMAARLPRATLVRFDGVGHRVLADRPDEVARALSGLLERVRAQREETSAAAC